MRALLRYLAAPLLGIGLVLAGASCAEPEHAGADAAGFQDGGAGDSDAAVNLDGGAGPDAGPPCDAGPYDGGPVDGGPVDGGPVDGGVVDAGSVDAGPGDAGPCGVPGDVGP